MIITETVSPDTLPPTLFGRTAYDTQAWYRATLDTALPPGATPCFQIVSDGPDILAILPMLRHASRLCALATPYTCLWQPLLAPDLGPARLTEIGRALAPLWRRAGNVHLEALAPENTALPAIFAGLRQSGLRVLPFNNFGNWHLDVTGQSWTTYLATRPGELRSTIKRATNRLMRGSGVVFTLVQSQDGLEPAIAAYKKIYEESWKQPEPYPAFNPTLMRACAANGTLRLGTLTLADTPIATQFWLVHHHWAGVQKLAHTEARRALAPGTVLTALMIRHLLETDHAHTLDFGRGDDAYKASWTGTRRQRTGALVVNPLSAPGMLAMARHYGGQAKKGLLF